MTKIATIENLHLFDTLKYNWEFTNHSNKSDKDIDSKLPGMVGDKNVYIVVPDKAGRYDLVITFKDGNGNVLDRFAYTVYVTHGEPPADSNAHANGVHTYWLDNTLVSSQVTEVDTVIALTRAFRAKRYYSSGEVLGQIIVSEIAADPSKIYKTICTDVASAFTELADLFGIKVEMKLWHPTVDQREKWHDPALYPTTSMMVISDYDHRTGINKSPIESGAEAEIFGPIIINRPVSGLGHDWTFYRPYNLSMDPSSGSIGYSEAGIFSAEVINTENGGREFFRLIPKKQCSIQE